MQDLTAKRTLVKSPPELWNELSEVERLARHLDAFGEIKITKLEPEHTVAWEGEGASGTVSIEPSGWGTKVTLTAQVEQAAAEPNPPGTAPPETAAAKEEPPSRAAAPPEPEPEPELELELEPEPEPELGLELEPAPEPEGSPELGAPRRRGFFARLFGRRTPAAAVAEEPEPHGPEPVAEEPGPVAEEPAPEPEPAAPEPEPAAPIAEEPAPEPEPPAPGPPPEPVSEEPVHDAPAAPAPRDLQAILDDVLEALGSAHHRPFSRG